MPHTVVADFAVFTGQTYDDAQETRIAYWLTAAERQLRRLTGVDFYETDDPESDASQDWIEATVRLAEQSFVQEDPEVRAAMLGPYSSEKIGDYSYSLKSGMGTDLPLPARVAEIVAQYSAYGGNPVLAGVTLAHPERLQVPYHVGCDVSRRIEGGEL